MKQAAPWVGAVASTCRDRPSWSSSSSTTPRKRPRRETTTCGSEMNCSSVSGPEPSAARAEPFHAEPFHVEPVRTTATWRSSNSGLLRTSAGSSVGALMSRSTRSRRSAGSSSPSGRIRSRTPGASRATLAAKAAPRTTATASLVRMVNSRCREAMSTVGGGRSAARASARAASTCGCSSRARGVSASPRPAGTSSGSPTTRRSRPSVLLMAEADTRISSAAPVTLPSRSRASRAGSRFRSGSCMGRNASFTTKNWCSAFLLGSMEK